MLHTAFEPHGFTLHGFVTRRNNYSIKKNRGKFSFFKDLTSLAIKSTIKTWTHALRLIIYVVTISTIITNGTWGLR